MKIKYYSLKKILSYKAIYNIIFGQRSNGKTFSVIDLMIKTFCQKGLSSAYIRRLDTELIISEIGMLLKPQIDNIIKYSKGKYNSYIYKSRIFFLTHVNINGDIEYTSDPCIYCLALSKSPKSKGADRGEIAYTLFDEFLTRQFYLNDEFILYTETLSTLIRDRDTTINFLIGNTVNKYCPYFQEMGLTHVQEQKQGTIDFYTYGDSELTVAVEYCEERKMSKSVSKYFAFDNPHLQMINTGVWEFANYPHAPEKITQNMVIDRSFLEFDKNKLCINFVMSDSLYLYICPHTKDISDNAIMFTHNIDQNPLHIVDPRTSKIKLCRVLWELIQSHRVFYSDNTTGEIFNNWIKNLLKITIYKS